MKQSPIAPRMCTFAPVCLSILVMTVGASLEDTPNDDVAVVNTDSMTRNLSRATILSLGEVVNPLGSTPTTSGTVTPGH